MLPCLFFFPVDIPISLTMFPSEYSWIFFDVCIVWLHYWKAEPLCLECLSQHGYITGSLRAASTVINKIKAFWNVLFLVQIVRQKMERRWQHHLPYCKQHQIEVTKESEKQFICSSRLTSPLSAKQSCWITLCNYKN